jgi:hypothetical protein
MSSLIFQVIAWPTLVTALLVWGFGPGAVLRLIVLAFPKDDPRRRELRGELYAVPRIERPFWVFEKLELALFEGLRGRLVRRGNRLDAAKAHSGAIYSVDRTGGSLKIVRRLASGCPAPPGEKCPRCGRVNDFDEDGWPINGPESRRQRASRPLSS